MKLGIILLAASTIALSTGCATILKGSRESLTIVSEPAGAKVQINGADLGNTPLTTRVHGTNDQMIQVRKEGYETRSILVASSVGAGWIVVDLVCGILPLIVDAVTGDWKSLDQNNVNVVLEKK
jgi:hypothetical protein